MSPWLGIRSYPVAVCIYHLDPPCCSEQGSLYTTDHWQERTEGHTPPRAGYTRKDGCRHVAFESFVNENAAAWRLDLSFRPELTPNVPLQQIDL